MLLHFPLNLLPVLLAPDFFLERILGGKYARSEYLGHLYSCCQVRGLRPMMGSVPSSGVEQILPVEVWFKNLVLDRLPERVGYRFWIPVAVGLRQYICSLPRQMYDTSRPSLIPSLKKALQQQRPLPGVSIW